MSIKKGDVYLLCEEPTVVGVVTSVKDSKAEIFNISTSLGDKIKWYNKTLRFSGAQDSSTPEFKVISEDTKLTLATKKVKTPFGTRTKYLCESIGDFKR